MAKDIVPLNTTSLTSAGQMANQYASANVFTDYHDRIAANTIRRQKDDLALFSTYLQEAGVTIDAQDLYDHAEAWDGVTYGLVDGFVRWMLTQGYAIGSVNVRLATIKRYCGLCAKTGAIPPGEYGLIKLVTGYRHSEGKNVDQRRKTTRKGYKKADPISINKEQALQLKSQPDTPQGRRDTLLMCLLLDHGLRCGEIAALKPENINLSDGTLTFYREKVDLIQIHNLTSDTARAAQRYLEVWTPDTTLIAGSRKTGDLQGLMSERAITKRMKTLATRIGIDGASAHDGRHAWATFAVRNGTDIKSLQDAGGWKSIAMPLRYVESNKIANEGVKLG